MVLFAVTGAGCLCQGSGQDVFPCFFECGCWRYILAGDVYRLSYTSKPEQPMCGRAAMGLLYQNGNHHSIVYHHFRFTQSKSIKIDTVSVYICGELVTYLRSPQDPNYQKPPIEDWLFSVLLFKLHQSTIFIHVY